MTRSGTVLQCGHPVGSPNCWACAAKQASELEARLERLEPYITHFRWCRKIASTTNTRVTCDCGFDAALLAPGGER